MLDNRRKGANISVGLNYVMQCRKRLDKYRLHLALGYALDFHQKWYLEDRQDSKSINKDTEQSYGEQI